MKQENMMLDTINFTESAVEFRFLFVDNNGIKSGFSHSFDRTKDAAQYEALLSFTSSPCCSRSYPMVRGIYDGAPSSSMIALGHIFEDQFFELDGTGEIIPYRQLAAKYG